MSYVEEYREAFEPLPPCRCEGGCACEATNLYADLCDGCEASGCRPT